MNRSVPYPSRLNLASLPTPLHPLSRLSETLGGPTIWIKRDDLTGSLLTGNKVRKLEFTLASAIEEGHNLFITCGGVQSNHCRATAFAGAQLGIPVHLVLRGQAPESFDGNLFLDALAGAKIDYVDTHQYQNQLEAILAKTAETYRSQGLNPYIIPTGASDGVGVWGYFAACEELVADFRRLTLMPDLIVTATGSGGTQAGLSLGADYFELGAGVLGIAVCDNKDYFQQKVYKDLSEFYKDYGPLFEGALPSLDSISINTHDGYIGQGYGIASEPMLDCIIQLARMEGVVLDPVYTGKAFYALVSEIQKGRYRTMRNIVFIHTGGNYGTFPYREALMQRMHSSFAT